MLLTIHNILLRKGLGGRNRSSKRRISIVPYNVIVSQPTKIYKLTIRDLLTKRSSERENRPLVLM